MASYYKPEDKLTIFTIGRIMVTIPDSMTIKDIQHCLWDKTRLALVTNEYKPITDYLPSDKEIKDNQLV